MWRAGVGHAPPRRDLTVNDGAVACDVSPGPAGHVRHSHMGYHMVMARREVLVQLDDDLVGRLDEIARAQGTSRSALLREGARAVIDADERLAADRHLVDAYRHQPEDPALIESAARLAARTVPEW